MRGKVYEPVAQEADYTTSRGDRDMGKWSFERWVMLGMLIFTIGSNWGRVWDSKGDIDTLKKFNEETLPKAYVSRELYDANQAHLTEAIDRLTKSLDKLYALELQTGEPARVQRQFDK